MTLYVDDPHELMRGLEAQAESQDPLMRRLVDQLRDMIDAREELESLVRLQSIARSARTAFLVEAAEILLSHEEQAEIVSLTKFRRPKLRIVQ